MLQHNTILFYGDNSDTLPVLLREKGLAWTGDGASAQAQTSHYAICLPLKDIEIGTLLADSKGRQFRVTDYFPLPNGLFKLHLTVSGAYGI